MGLLPGQLLLEELLVPHAVLVCGDGVHHLHLVHGCIPTTLSGWFKALAISMMGRPK